MKMIRKVAMSAMGLVFIGSSVFAQSLADAKNAIDAEKYQSAKSMLKNLTVTQPTKDENFFYLGWVYLIQDHIDSAKLQFNKGIAVEPKSALNYVGLGAVARLSKDPAGATTNFNKAIELASRKDADPYLYIGKSYLLPVGGSTTVSPADAAAAISILEKAKENDKKLKNADIDITLGNADLSQLKSSDADSHYSEAIADNPKSLPAYVAKGSLLRMAHNWDGAVEQFKAALAIDPNFGPAYREWAETDYRQATNDRAVAVAKIKEAVDHYKKYLDLTDRSLESQLRYADFLVNAGDYKSLQEVASTLASSVNSNPRVYRYLGYAAYENKDYPAALAAMNNWFAKAESARILPSDYMYLGRIQIASGKDTTAGLANLKKAVAMDSTKAEDIYNTDIIPLYKAKKDYLNMAKSYEEMISFTPGKSMLNEHFNEAWYYYFALDPKKPDTILMAKADTALEYVNRLTKDKPVPQVALTRARIESYRDTDYTNMNGSPKPYYEKYISLVTANGAVPTAADVKRSLAEAYAYLGVYAEYHDKDDAKAMDYFTKAREMNPDNAQAKFYFDKKGAGQKAPPAQKK